MTYFQKSKRENFFAERDRRIRRLIERIRGTIRKRSIAVELSRTLARRTRGRYVEESYVRIDHVRTWSRDRVALVFRIRQPCRKMKRIIASPRLCTLLDISVHQPLDSDILMPKGSTRRFRLCTVDTSDYICTRMAVYTHGFRICTPNIRPITLRISPHHHRRRVSLCFTWYVHEIGSSDLGLISRDY